VVLQLVSLQEVLLPFPSNLLPAVLGLMCKVAPHTDLWDFSAAVGELWSTRFRWLWLMRPLWMVSSTC
jgi:hypothetical protein